MHEATGCLDNPYKFTSEILSAVAFVLVRLKGNSGIGLMLTVLINGLKNGALRNFGLIICSKPVTLFVENKTRRKQ